MKQELLSGLSKWKESLDNQIKTTDECIQKSIEKNSYTCSVLDEVEALALFVHENDLPEKVLSGLLKCLKWNPFAQ